MKSLTLFTALCVLLWSATASSAVVILDGISAVVDDDVIMRSEVAGRMTTIKAQMAAQEGARLPPDRYSGETGRGTADRGKPADADGKTGWCENQRQRT